MDGWIGSSPSKHHNSQNEILKLMKPKKDDTFLIVQNLQLEVQRSMRIIVISRKKYLWRILKLNGCRHMRINTDTMGVGKSKN